MEIPKQRHEKRKVEARTFWGTVVAEYNGGMTAKEIADKHINPKTNKHYTREHILWILRQLRTKIIAPIK